MKVKNETISKLDRHEIAGLELLNHGIITYKGELKSRRQGWKVEKPTEYQTNFVGTYQTIEFIEIIATNPEGKKEYAMRVRNNASNEYERLVHCLTGLDFLR